MRGCGLLRRPRYLRGARSRDRGRCPGRRVLMPGGRRCDRARPPRPGCRRSAAGRRGVAVAGWYGCSDAVGGALPCRTRCPCRWPVDPLRRFDGRCRERDGAGGERPAPGGAGAGPGVERWPGRARRLGGRSVGAGPERPRRPRAAGGLPGAVRERWPTRFVAESRDRRRCRGRRPAPSAGRWLSPRRWRRSPHGQRRAAGRPAPRVVDALDRQARGSGCRGDRGQPW